MAGPTTRPLIAIPARFSASASALRYRADVLPRALVAAVHAARGEPLAVHPVAGTDPDPDQVAERLTFADGIVLPGGGDLAARWARQPEHPSLYDVDPEQDAFDLAVAVHALRTGVPLLAICRGLQVVNVVRGGDLVQDLAESTGDHRHRVHDVVVAEDSLLHATIGPELEVSCFHHQSLGRLGAGLRSVAHSVDGVVEAVELKEPDGDDGWFLGLQWHPEDTAAIDARQAAIFAALVTAALQRRDEILAR